MPFGTPLGDGAALSFGLSTILLRGRLPRSMPSQFHRGLSTVWRPCSGTAVEPLRGSAKLRENTMRIEMFRTGSRWLALFIALAVPVAAAGAPHMIKKIPVGGDYGWDYLTRRQRSPPLVCIARSGSSCPRSRLRCVDWQDSGQGRFMASRSPRTLAEGSSAVAIRVLS